MKDLFTLPSTKLRKTWSEAAHPRDSQGRWAEVGGIIAREAGGVAVSAGLTALLGAVPGLFSVARQARTFGAVGSGARREAFLAPYRSALRRIRR